MPTPKTNNRRRSLACGLTAGLLLGSGAAATAAPAPPGPPGGQADQQLATLDHDTGAFLTPGPDTRRLTELSDGRPITGERTVLPVVGHATGPYGLRWLKVLLPGRPNSHTGWIQQRATSK